jgi:hypothetical protein
MNILSQKESHRAKASWRLCQDNPILFVGDESWVFQYDSETKRHKLQWTSQRLISCQGFINTIQILFVALWLWMSHGYFNMTQRRNVTSCNGQVRDSYHAKVSSIQSKFCSLHYDWRWVMGISIWLRDETSQDAMDKLETHIMPRLCQDNPNFVRCIMTLDESWVFQYDSETNPQKVQWTSKSSPRPRKFGFVIHKEFVPKREESQ